MIISKKFKTTLLLALAMSTTVASVSAMPQTIVMSEEANQIPVIYGASDIIVPVWSKIDLLEGVQVLDPQEGDITSRLTIEGTVNAYQPGIYDLVYRAVDSEGNVGSHTRRVKVYAVKQGDTYEPSREYIENEIVVYNGKEYRAKWWTKGDIPGYTEAWEATDGSQVAVYEEGKVYYEGDVVKFGDTVYMALARTRTNPEQDPKLWNVLY